MRLHWLAVACALCSTGCPNTDAAVFVEPTIEDANANLQVSALSAAIGGTFNLRLHLGPRATDTSEVDLQQFSVTSADRVQTILAPLQAVTTPRFPVPVGVDSDVVVAVAFDPTDNLLDTSAVAPLCDPAGIDITGTLDDSLRGASVPVASPPFPVQRCP
jgi:hypothetical protein